MNGNKYDSGKPMSGLMLRDFAGALTKVAEVSTYGCLKYGSPSGWQRVENGQTRYHDALVRHLLSEPSQEKDEESGLLHLAHAAWNALAILELKLKEKKDDPRIG
jgi:hypothetical protein